MHLLSQFYYLVFHLADFSVFPFAGSNYNLGQNILNKIQKFSNTRQDKKSLISTFAFVLTAIAKETPLLKKHQSYYS